MFEFDDDESVEVEGDEVDAEDEVVDVVDEESDDVDDSFEEEVDASAELDAVELELEHEEDDKDVFIDSSDSESVSFSINVLSLPSCCLSSTSHASCLICMLCSLVIEEGSMLSISSSLIRTILLGSNRFRCVPSE